MLRTKKQTKKKNREAAPDLFLLLLLIFLDVLWRLANQLVVSFPPPTGMESDAMISSIDCKKRKKRFKIKRTYKDI